jgi:hypothetical protein
MAIFRASAIGLLALSTLGCGGSNSPTAPSPPPPPAQISGAWSGTLESTTYAPLAVFLTLSQTSATVSGTWAAQSGTAGLAGNINGTVDSATFTGTITLSINQTAGCSGSFSGSALTGAPTMSWSGAGFTGNCNLNLGNPLSPRFVLQRR